MNNINNQLDCWGG